MKIPYFLVDVFTRHKLTGNPLAVVLGGEKLSDSQMQAIANEFNLSETAFLREHGEDQHSASLRIFTPSRELPFAGHPTVGAAVLVGIRRRASAVRLEEHLGVITCVTEQIAHRSGYARFGLPSLPEAVGPAPDTEVLAGALGLAPGDIGFAGLEPAVWSAGLPTCLIPVRDTGVLDRVEVERRGWEQVFSGNSSVAYLFCPTPDEADMDFGARMFAPLSGIAEDPATGSAAAALIGMLAANGSYGDGQHNLRLRQGFEMGRPSQIDLQMRIQLGQLTHAGIGGWAVVLGEGQLDLIDL